MLIWQITGGRKICTLEEQPRDHQDVLKKQDTNGTLDTSFIWRFQDCKLDPIEAGVSYHSVQPTEVIQDTFDALTPLEKSVNRSTRCGDQSRDCENIDSFTHHAALESEEPTVSLALPCSNRFHPDVALHAISTYQRAIRSTGPTSFHATPSDRVLPDVHPRSRHSR